MNRSDAMARLEILLRQTDVSRQALRQLFAEVCDAASEAQCGYEEARENLQQVALKNVAVLAHLEGAMTALKTKFEREQNG